MKTYELVTLADVYEQVPAEKIELCMREIAAGMLLAKDFATLAGDESKALHPERWTWIDDGKDDKAVHIPGSLTLEMKGAR